MSSEGTDHLSQASGESVVDVKHEPRKTPKFSYTREFLLFLSELDACKKLPAGFDSSVLSEFEDASNSALEWQRSAGGLSLQGSKHNDYGSASSNPVEGAGYARGSHGRWDTRSTGSNDKDGETQNDRESFSQDSGRHYVNQSQRPWQKPEPDGLLGSGAFPRSSGYQGWASAPKGRGSGGYQLNKSSEPYQPPRPYKATPYSRRENTDSFNDETFGSSECSTVDRAEEERKRRASFELMRKEQQKALQEKQKQTSDKHKDNFDNNIIALLKNPEVDQSENNGKHEENASLLVSQADFGRFSSHTLTSASRPLFPPGFASTTVEKNIGKLSSVTLGPMVGSVDRLLTRETIAVNVEESNPKNRDISGSSVHSDMSDPSSISIPFVDAVEPPLTGPLSDSSIDCENVCHDASYLLQAKGNWKNDVINGLNENKIAEHEVSDMGRQDNSTSILDKLFGTALTNDDTMPKSDEGAEIDEKTWSPTASQSSKFASWFLEDDKRPAKDLSSRDLLSLIVCKKKAGPATSAVSHELIHPTLSFENSETGQIVLTSTATPSINEIPELYCHSSKPDTSSGVLTCEDLEQSILAEVKESSSSLQGTCHTLDSNFEQQKANVDDHASQHLLSLLHKGKHSSDFTSFLNPEPVISSEIDGCVETISDATVCFAGHISPDNSETVNSETGKSLTLEALFGSAFMKELHSREAPISQQRGSDDDCMAMSQVRAMPPPAADNKFLSGEYESDIIHKENMSHILGARLQKLEEPWMCSEDSQTKKLKPADDVGHGSGSLEIHLPEEETLITLGDAVNPVLCEYFPIENAPKAEGLLDPRTDEILVDKLASLSVIGNNERSSSSVFDAPARCQYPVVEQDLKHRHLHGQPFSSRFPSSQINHVRSYLQQSDNPSHKNPQAKLVGPENIHHGLQHPFLGNIIHQHPLHNPGGPRLDPTFHLSMPQSMLSAGNFSPQHLQIFPRGLPLSHPLNRMIDYMPEAVQNFHRQPGYGGYGMGMPGTGVNSPAGNHPLPFGNLMEMNNLQNPDLPAAGHIPGIYDPEVDMGFRYR